MSGEYYASEEPVNKFYKQYSCSSQTAKPQKISDSNELGMKDLEKHLEIAESRCNVLHDQLDNLKQTYGTNRSNQKTRKLSTLPHQRKEQSEDQVSVASLTEDLSSSRNPARQSSNVIGTDTTGAAVRTINNILNGITDSVNRLSELHVKVSESPRIKIDRQCSGIQDCLGREIVTKSSTAINIDVNLHNRKLKECASKPNTKNASSTSVLRRALKINKKSRNVSRKTHHDENENAEKHYKKFAKNGNYLVELYHNDASQLHHSDSDEGQSKKPRNHAQHYEEVPPLAIYSRRPDASEILRHSTRPDTARNGRRTVSNPFFEPPEAPRTEIMGLGSSKNYELPTVSSKMKQVAKSYLTGLNFKVIPFCPAMSTTPSHNIGINIQQVMNVIKNRQPFQGISLTLAHNIGLAAEKLNNKPFTALVSRINSRIVSASKCPLSKSTMNYSELQEMAKGIPEDIIEEADEDSFDTPDIKTVYITGPSGDVEIKTRNVPSWMADPIKDEQCTCVLQPNVDIEKVSNKYVRSCRTLTNRSINSQIISHKRRMMKTRTAEPKYRAQTRTSLYHENVKTKTAVSPNREQQEIKLMGTESMCPTLQGREKNLKLVLTNLHNEFEEINKKYDELCEKSSKDEQNNENVKELEQLETQLNKKEEEITMVMALYKEVLALKQQVKLLKEKKSQPSIGCKDQQETKLKFKEYNNPEAAFHLTKLLRQIQHYQMRYKTDLESGE